ncbi:MAG: nuclear transport factor 2 family protein [Actinomycetales bacterium]
MAGTAHALMVLQARAAAADCLATYLHRCDVPGGTGAEQAAELFTQDAVWEGIGPEYSTAFGRARGRAEIAALLGRYLPPVEHFHRNVHLLGSGAMQVDLPEVRGRWTMQQLSHQVDGTAQLLCAGLEVDFEVTADQASTTALIKHFRTRRQFAAELDAGMLHPWTRP